jgi:hypothetical protein
MLPGAFEARAVDAVRPIVASSAPPIRDDAHDAARSRGTLEREREGGGAPSERRRATTRSPFVWLLDQLIDRLKGKL